MAHKHIHLLLVQIQSHIRHRPWTLQTQNLLVQLSILHRIPIQKTKSYQIHTKTGWTSLAHRGLVWVEAEVSAVEEGGGFEVLSVPEATDSSFDGNDFPVLSFGDGICDSVGAVVGTARSLLPKSAGLRSPAWVSLAVAQFPRARRRAFFRAELQSDLIVVSRRAAQRSGGVSSMRER
jgi:hypothetical protein